MSLLHSAKQLTTGAAIVVAFASAYFWFRASKAKITEPANIHDPGIELAYEDPENPGQNIYVVATAMEQSRLNKIAAIYTGLAAFFQAGASLLP